MRTKIALVACGYCLGLAAGCSHMTENRVARAFAESLKEQDLAKLKDQTSNEFEDKAIQGEATFDVLKMIDIPEGQAKVVKVINKKDENDKRKIIEKRVTVQFGDKKTGIKKYWLRMKPEDDRWVVDNVYLSRKDEKANKSLALKISVLLSLHESLDAWKAADRDRMLASATPELATALGDLSPEHLTRFARQVTADVAEQQQVLSQDRIGEETAELRVARGTQGELTLKLRQVDGRWKLDDLQIDARHAGDNIASVRQVMAAMAAAQSFQEAYHAADKSRLEKLATPQFYNGSLAGANLSIVKLPGAVDPDQKFDVRLDGSAATYVVTAGAEVLKISLERQNSEKYHQAPKYLVEDVTIYELNGSEDKRLSALFTGHATLNAFSRALATQDIKALRDNATHDFNQRVWSHLRMAHFPRLPIGELRSSEPRIVQTDFKGSLTEVHVEQGSTPLTYVLRDEGGRMLVDDILIPATSRPESLKTNVEMFLPVMEFALALEHSEMDEVRGQCTSELSRLAWNHFYDRAPEFKRDPLPHLAGPLTGLRVDGDRAVLLLGSARFGSEVRLEKERGRFRIDDVILVTGPEDAQKIGLKRVIDKRPRMPVAANLHVDALVSEPEPQD